MDSKREFYITVSPKLNIELTDVVGKIEFLDSTLGNMLIDMLNKGVDFDIKPFGYGNMDESGDIKDFKLMGFTIKKNAWD